MRTRKSPLFFFAFSTRSITEVRKMKGFYTDGDYWGLMPDGKYHRFPTDTEYKEAYAEATAS